MEYKPITDKNKDQWVNWLQHQVTVLDGQSEDKNQNAIFGTPEGDVATGKDLVGNLLALLTDKTITIN